MAHKPELIVMGGSWGGIQASMAILQGLPADYGLPIVLVLHRLRNFDSDLQQIYKKKVALQVQEVEEKEPIRPGHVYLAPANYHVLIEHNRTFSLDVSEPEHFSRPSIDVTFVSAADVYGPHLVGILLSGANRDGSVGLRYIVEKKGRALVQDPAEAEMATMPQAAIQLLPKEACAVANVQKIQAYLFALTQ